MTGPAGFRERPSRGARFWHTPSDAGCISASLRDMELQWLGPWDASRHRANTASARGECSWAAPCPEPAKWSVLVTYSGGESWWAACARHAATSAVLSTGKPAD